MRVGAARVELRVHSSQSLKAKRGVVRSIRQRLRNRFNVAVAEVGGQASWQRVVLGLATTANDATAARHCLERAIEFIEELHLAEVMDQEIEIW